MTDPTPIPWCGQTVPHAAHPGCCGTAAAAAVADYDPDAWRRSLAHPHDPVYVYGDPDSPVEHARRQLHPGAPEAIAYAVGALARLAAAYLRHAFVVAGYTLRPYDSHLDRRRWRWQPAGCPTPAERQRLQALLGELDDDQQRDR